VTTKISRTIKTTCILCGNNLIDGMDLSEIGNEPGLCLMNEQEADQFGPHIPMS
jgi:hypothetical protein